MTSRTQELDPWKRKAIEKDTYNAEQYGKPWGEGAPMSEEVQDLLFPDRVKPEQTDIDDEDSDAVASNTQNRR